MKSKENDKTQGTEEAWDEKTLGATEEFVAVADVDDEAINSALELQAISIRLQKSLIEDFKVIAGFHGLGYQPLMRQALARFADGEKKRLIREYACKQAKELEGQKRLEKEQKNGKKVA